MMQRIKNLIKSLQKYAWILFLIIVVGFFCLNTCDKQDYERKLKWERIETQYWRDKSQNEHAKFQLAELQKAQMQAEVDSMARVLSVKPKQITRYIKAGIRIDTTIIAKVDTITKTDTVTGEITRSYNVEFKDSTFLHIKGTVPSNPQAFEVGVGVDLTISEYWKRKKILGLKIGKKTHYVDIGTNNPYVKLSNVEGFKLKDQPKLRVRPGMGIGLNIDPFTGKVTPGVQVGIYLIKSR